MCWAFGMASLLETSFLTQGLELMTCRKSIWRIFANRKNDPLGNTYGDVNKHMGTDDKGNVDYHEGGNDLLASMFLSTWWNDNRSGCASGYRFHAYTENLW